MQIKPVVVFSCLAAVAAGVLWLPRMPAETPVRDRLNGEIGGSWSRLRGSVSPLARPQSDQGSVADSFPLNRITMVFKPTETQQSALIELLDEQQDPASKNFHRWLTPEEFADRFGLSNADVAKVVSWLEVQGFTVIETARSRTWISFSGTAGQVRAAFNAQIHRYQVDGELHYSNATDASVPDALAGVVLGIRALNNFHPRPLPLRVRRVAAGPRFTSSVTGEHFLAPDDFATIYSLQALYNSGITGSTVKIAVMGQTDFAQSDITTFRQNSGLAANQPTVILVPGSPDPGTQSGDVEEADLDLEWSGGSAPNASIIYVNSTDSFDSLQYAIDANLAPVMSISYGGCEAGFDSASLNSLALSAMQANSQGITITSAAGDDGGADCDSGTPTSPAKTATHGLAVDFPASMPYVTGLGGTRFLEQSNSVWSSTNNSKNGSALSYIDEETWNDSAADGVLAATGGGASAVFAKPGWQWGTGVPDDGARDVPDVAVSASADHDGYLVCSQGSCVNGFRAADGTLSVVGGTSVGAPTFAGIVALIDQKTGSRQGNINYVLYPLAAGTTDVFHDITIGSNKVPCKVGSTDCPNGAAIGYNAGVGYDEATGLGSIDATNLANEWASVPTAPRDSEDFQLTASPTDLTITSGASGNATITLAAQNNFTGAVAFTCTVASNLTGTTCSVTPTSVTTGGTTTLTIKVPAAARSFPDDWKPQHPPAGPALPAVMLTLLLAGLLTLVWRRHRVAGAYRYRSFRARLALGYVLAGLLAAALSCGGGSSSSPAPSPPAPAPVKGNVTVQGVSGNLKHLADVAVTVK
jgi:subtilase family serine protease